MMALARWLTGTSPAAAAAMDAVASRYVSPDARRLRQARADAARIREHAQQSGAALAQAFVTLSSSLERGLAPLAAWLDGLSRGGRR